MAFNQVDEELKIDDGYHNPYISPRTKMFYLNTDSADVYFVFDGSNGDRIPAHKVVMSVACDAFNAMFHGDLREPGDVRIDDASSDGFKEFLKFFYFDKVKLSMEHIEEVVYLSTKYVYSSGIKICEVFLLESLNIENACFCYGLTMTYDLIELKQKCEDFIAQNTLAVLHTVDFLECDKSMVIPILKLDELSCNEIDLFKWCIDWVKAAGKEEKVTRQLIDDQFGSLFRDIRFGTMTNEHLKELLSKYGDLFAFDEYQEIVQLIASKDFHPVLFKEEPRLLPYKQSDAIKWPVQKPTESPAANSWRTLREYESVTFSTNKHILLGGIGLKEITCARDLSIEFVILRKSIFKNDENSQIVLHQVHKYIGWREGNFTKLHKPLILSPNFEYEIQLKIALNSPYTEYRPHIYPLLHYNICLDNIKTKAIDRNTITMRKLSAESLIDSLHFNVISNRVFRL